jgi:hypothetical protein
VIVCSCRVISTTDYEDIGELIDRIMSDDADCGSCQVDVETLLNVVEFLKHNEENKK